MRLLKLKVSIFVILGVFLVLPAYTAGNIEKDLYIGQVDIPSNVWGPNPFLTPGEEQALTGEDLGVEGYLQEKEETDILSQLHLEALFYSPKKKTAIVNGQIVKIGYKVSGYEVLDITSDSVVLEIERRRCELMLRDIKR